MGLPIAALLILLSYLIITFGSHVVLCDLNVGVFVYVGALPLGNRFSLLIKKKKKKTLVFLYGSLFANIASIGLINSRCRSNGTISFIALLLILLISNYFWLSPLFI